MKGPSKEQSRNKRNRDWKAIKDVRKNKLVHWKEKIHTSTKIERVLKTRNEMGAMTNDGTKIPRILRDYYENY
jgi:hypothetical protein